MVSTADEQFAPGSRIAPAILVTEDDHTLQVKLSKSKLPPLKI